MFATTQVSGSFENALKPLAAITLASPVVTQVSQPRTNLRCKQANVFFAVTSANVMPSITPVRTASAMSEVPAISEILTSKTATKPKKSKNSKKAKTSTRKVKASRTRGVTVPTAAPQRVVLLPVALRSVAVRQIAPKPKGTTYSFQGPNGKQTVTVRTVTASSKTTYLTRGTTPLKAAVATHVSHLNSRTSQASNQDIEVLGVATPTKRSTKQSTMPTVTFPNGTTPQKSAPATMPELTEQPATTMPQKTEVTEVPATTMQKTEVTEVPATTMPQKTEVTEMPAMTMPQKTQVTGVCEVAAVPEEALPFDATFEGATFEDATFDDATFDDATFEGIAAEEGAVEDELSELTAKQSSI
ncbi:MAG: uncharacterized protein KVP18_000362 [Porospora cf. gigantea A]|uniref:uncharacterized protein n=1 Tax=Porospora cf. gigantea A TaxID=2853593 RepID=UPI00355ABA30|nr:MAG: hypothetical protein KVP18_000362 [Porospora cf. gigantea A]